MIRAQQLTDAQAKANIHDAPCNEDDDVVVDHEVDDTALTTHPEPQRARG